MSTPEANLEGNSLPDAELNTASLQGSLFPKGDSGEIIIEATITTEPGTNAEVINSGTRSKAKLTFKIPRGNTGATGNGIASVTKVGTQGLVDTYRITMTDGTYYDFTVTNADVGSAYTKTETNQLLDAKVDKTSINQDVTTPVATGDDGKLASLAAVKNLRTSINTAISNINTNIGDLTSLSTTAKNNLVAAINELVTSIAAKVATTDFNTTVTTLTNNINTKTDAKYYESTFVTLTEDFVINSPLTPTAGTEYKVHFATWTGLGPIQARLSVDNGTTFYNVDGCTAQALSGEYLTVMFDGTKFVVTTGLGPVSIEYVAEV